MTHLRYSAEPVFSSMIEKIIENQASESRFARFLPNVDFAESDKQFELYIALPGIDKKDVNIDVNNGNLTVSGERKFDFESKEKTLKSIETKFGVFNRSFKLPENIDISKISAEFKNGILEIVIPKDEKVVQKAKIEIK